MSLIVNVEIPAGPTIKEAIRDCVEFAKRNNVMVKTKINDVPMLICFGSAFGKNVDECVETFVEEFDFLNVQQRNH